MKVFAIALANLKSVKRNIKSHLIVFILPIVFMGIFALVFGQKTSEYTFKIATVSNENPAFEQYIDQLKTLKTTKDKDRFTIIPFDNATEARNQVEQGKQVAMLSWQDAEPHITLSGDPTNVQFTIAQAYIDGFSKQFFQVANSYLIIDPLAGTSVADVSGFYYLVPGLIVYGILILIPQAASVLSSLTEKQYVFRYFTSRVKAWEVILGFLLSQTVLAIIQTILLFSTALAFGFEAKGSILAAILIALPTNLFAVGIGLLLGGLMQTEDAASNAGTMISIILGFLSGSFVQFPTITLIPNLWGHDLTLTDFIPSAHAAAALRQILLFNKGLGDVMGDIIVLVVSAVLILMIGIVIFNQKRLKYQSS